MSEPFTLVLKPAARRALAETLPSAAAFAAWEFVNGPRREAPQRLGKPLVGPLQGEWSARRGYIRVRYRIDEDKHVITIIDVAHRSDIYNPRRF